MVLRQVGVVAAGERRQWRCSKRCWSCSHGLGQELCTGRGAWLGAGLEALDDDHAAAAVGTGLGESRRLGAIVALAIIGFGLPRRHGEQVASQGEVPGPAAVGEEAIMADAVKARGQDMEEEAADELERCQGHSLVALASFAPIVLEFEDDAPLVAADQTAI